MSHASGGGRQPKGRSGFTVAELLEVSHQHNVTVFFVELFNGDQKP